MNHIDVSLCAHQKRTVDILELEFHTVMSYLVNA